MRVQHLEVLTEERSMEAFLQTLLPRILPDGSTFTIHPFRGKSDLLRKLQDRLSAYANWMPENFWVVVMIDRDNDDCRTLKEQLETIAADSGLLLAHEPAAVLGKWSIALRLRNWRRGISTTGKQ